MALNNPRVNGVVMSWSRIRHMHEADSLQGIRDVGFKCTVNGVAVYGSGRFKLGTTEGTVGYEGSLTFVFDYFYPFCKKLAPAGGWMDVKFDLVEVFRERDGSPQITVELIGLKMKENDHSFAQGDDGLEVTVPCELDKYLVDGLEPVIRED
jgi:hypothetical protein